MTPYGPVLRHPAVRRLLPGYAASALGDGMSAVAVSWLALELAPDEHRGLWVALAVAAFTFPGAAGTFLFSRLLRDRPGAQLVTWDSTLRAVTLGAIPVAAASGSLSISLYVILLAMSSLLHAWGSSGTYTLLAELLPERDHVAGNALLAMLGQTGVLAGPLLAGLLIERVGATWVLAADAVSFAVLAVTCRGLGGDRQPRSEPGSPGFGVLLADRRLLGLAGLTFLFYALYGPVEVGLPVLVSDVQQAPATVLAWYFTAFGGGAVAGGLLAGWLRDWPAGPVVAGIVLGVGAALLPLGWDLPVVAAAGCMAVAGFVYAPYHAITLAVFQRSAPREALASVLAARRTVLILSGPVGVGAGGVLVTTYGARPAFLVAGGGTVLLGLVTAGVVAVARARRASA
ncbi:MFS transporter [Symbioplanes lichenis]|uniref:MFS transporter n=1 Tax=Symbioplanes lichenis TaxID=1629072 RepID=UPI002738A797|nr:MFS transporter [Actinoplanes lichenis]